MMSKIRVLFLLVLAIFIIGCQQKREGKPKILVFSKTMGFNHSSIPSGIAAIDKLGKEYEFVVDTTKNADLFRDDVLKDYSAIVFLSTTGNVLDNRQEAAFERYIQAGGGFVGIHAATDTEYDWNWFGRLVGAYFESHPPGVHEADFKVVDKNFSATSFIEQNIWKRTDELYNFKKIYEPINVILTVDENSYEGGTNGDFHPMAWYHEYDGGRSFYTAMGHTDESFAEEDFLKHILAGIQYAIGENYELDYKKATSQMPPEADRFSKVVLATGDFFEPTEMAILPNNDILIAQRRGQIMRYDRQTAELSEIAALDVYHQTLETPGVNAEEGLMGLQKDPDFDQNNWIYLYYAPTGDKWVNRLSRFQYKDGEFDLSSEQIILEVDSQREICCHTGGSIAFGPDKLLYLSTGDNATPFDEEGVPYANKGFAPLNDLEGKQQYDARRSSGNTNDLRGKVLRIKVNEDGSYDIPAGNLFPVGTEKTRPEIYTMGHRNPYRISVDQKNSHLYWGDIGPDAQGDSLNSRGPRGYDELNQATEAGNFGWPLFIADNKPYVEYDYATGESGEAFDPEKPINNSANNTGLKELPKAMPAYVYYPYAATQEFPQVGTGGRNAMAGPVLYSDLFKGDEKLPSYYDGKLIVYDWMRGWMKAVSFFEDDSFNKMEPFAPDVEVNGLIDMELGPDGTLYLLEYGSGWYSQNEDSALSFIQFNGGNRPPVIDNFIVDNDSGSLPLGVTFSVEAHDREEDPVTYLWDLGDGNTQETNEPTLKYEYSDVGAFKVSVRVVDDQGEEAISDIISITAGNTRPELNISLKGGNSTFYLPGLPIEYEVSAIDPDTEEEVNMDDVFVSVDYVSGMDQAQVSAGHKVTSSIDTGRELSLSLDCKACHKEKEASIGPSYLEVAEKYKDDKEAVNYLTAKIISGGGGVWAEVAMPAHPDLSESDSKMLSEYIMSLSGGGIEEKPSLPAKGIIMPNRTDPGTVLQISASYTDAGSAGAPALTGYANLRLMHSYVPFRKDIKQDGMTPITFNNTDLLLLPPGTSWFALSDMDLTGIQRANIMVGWQQPPGSGLDFEVRLNSPDGEVVGAGQMPAPVAGQPGGMVVIQMNDKNVTRDQELYFVYVPKEDNSRGDTPVALMGLSFQAD